MKNRIGIVGGGQLGRMLVFEAKRLGFTVNILDPTPQSPAGQVADSQIIADFKDENAIKKLANISDYLTFEIELANADILEELTNKGIVINPSAYTLNIIKDKLLQKKFLTNARIPVAPFAKVQTKQDIISITKKFGFPLLLKARFDAYDGRGNALINNEKEIESAFEKLKNRLLYVEKYVPFAKELAIMVARNATGEIKTYPLVETIHKNNICHLVLAPANVTKKIQDKAKKIGIKVLQHLKGAGVFGIEMFYTKTGTVLVNEIAPRVHNSGHYSLESCITNQFEQHIRAITGLPLGETQMVVKAVCMINILGQRNGPVKLTGLDKVLAIPNVFIHIYGKHETRLERKMGHITVIDKTIDKAHQKALYVRHLLSI